MSTHEPVPSRLCCGRGPRLDHYSTPPHFCDSLVLLFSEQDIWIMDLGIIYKIFKKVIKHHHPELTQVFSRPQTTQTVCAALQSKAVLETGPDRPR